MRDPVPLRVVPAAAVAFAVLGLSAGVAAAGVAGCSGGAGEAAGDGAAGDAAGDGSASPGDGGGVDAAHDALHDATGGDADATTACPRFGDAGAPVLLYELATAAYPDAGTPSVAVHVPPGFDPGNRPGVLAFFHGFDNCVANVVGATDTPCVDGGAARVAMHLVEQLDAARVNAILVAVELDADQATGDPGQLAAPGDFRALLHELFTQHLDAVLGCPLDVGGLDRVVVSSHSGGYWATASVLAQGMVPAITEVDLLDSLYGEQPTFDGWMQSSLARFATGRPDELRWVDVYTESGGTAANSRAMAASAQAWLDDAGLAASYFDDDTTDTLDAATYAHPVIFKLSGLTHDEVPQYYFGELARASGFAVIP
jgi:hypothetical protein